MFSCELKEVFKNISFTEHLWTTTSKNWSFLIRNLATELKEREIKFEKIGFCRFFVSVLQKDEKDINAKTIKKIILFVNLSKKFEHNSEKKMIELIWILVFCVNFSLLWSQWSLLTVMLQSFS